MTLIQRMSMSKSWPTLSSLPNSLHAIIILKALRKTGCLAVPFGYLICPLSHLHYSRVQFCLSEVNKSVVRNCYYVLLQDFFRRWHPWFLIFAPKSCDSLWPECAKMICQKFWVPNWEICENCGRWFTHLRDIQSRGWENGKVILNFRCFLVCCHPWCLECSNSGEKVIRR